MEFNKYRVKQDGQPLAKVAASGSDRVLQVFLNTDLRYAQHGLADLARKSKINVKELRPGQYVVFINRSKTMMKLFASSGVVASYISPHGRLQMEMIQEIPKAFRSEAGINFDRALEKALTKILDKKKPVKEVEVQVNKTRVITIGDVAPSRGFSRSSIRPPESSL